MAKINTAAELADKCKNIAKNYKTLYVMGCFGAPMTATNKKRYTQNHPYNQKPARTKLIMAASEDTFGFDCCGLIKGILWGWNGDRNRVYGGASYASNGVPDIGADSMIKVCNGVSTDFSKIEVGEVVWTDGHIGVYVGNGLAVEASPKWADKVQTTACNNDRAGYNRRDWKKHGRLPFVTYTGKNENVKTAGILDQECTVTLPVLRLNSESGFVKSMQVLLNKYIKSGLTEDGCFGPLTEDQVRRYQRIVGYPETGVCDAKMWWHLLK